MLAAEGEKPAAEGALRVAGEAWVKVIDFGLAKLCDNAERSATRVSLERRRLPARSKSRVREVDARSDIYSLGATLWYCLTGKVPFR